MPHRHSRVTTGSFHRAAGALTASLAICVLSCARFADGQTPQTVPAGAWEYGAISRMAADGLIAGYPADRNFLGGRTLTRYEFASLVARVLQTAHTAAAGSDARRAIAHDSGEIVQLVSAFKVELAVIGTDVEQGLKDVGAPGSLPAAPAEPPASGARFHPSAKFTGLMHTWYGTAFGDTLDGNFPALKTAPPGRTFGGGGGDTFRLRRLELAMNGTLSPHVDYRVMIDPTLPGAGGILQDMWAGYQLTPRWRIEVGQQKTGLSDDGNAPTSKSIMIEPAIMNVLPVTAGRVGNIRDIGAVARYGSKTIQSFVGIWNGNGTGRDAVATNSQKFLDA
ncbi:MAG: S-layer homology domain-containing protein, partial [Armatimonadetes bacterium]|nr:S-layer homology domain-containing protein [Armatimonadota bacterium]